MKIDITEIEHAGILAALRCYQEAILDESVVTRVYDVATNAGLHDPITAEEIDELVQKLQDPEEPKVWVVSSEGNNSPLDVQVFDSQEGGERALVGIIKSWIEDYRGHEDVEQFYALAEESDGAALDFIYCEGYELYTLADFSADVAEEHLQP